MVAAIEGALYNGLAEWGGRVHVFTHLSHLYRHGATVYTTYLIGWRPAQRNRSPAGNG